jgi:hypothetical protein
MTVESRVAVDDVVKHENYRKMAVELKRVITCMLICCDAKL